MTRTPNTFTHVVLITGSRTWSDEAAMRRAFDDAWLEWGIDRVQRPVLISGHCPTGADAMAERLWHQAGFEILQFPADWITFGKQAGFKRNQQMVDAALVLEAGGANTLCIAFLDQCAKPNCPQRTNQQLAPNHSEHFSHGTIHCRSRAIAADMTTIDVVTD